MSVRHRNSKKGSLVQKNNLLLEAGVEQVLPAREMEKDAEDANGEPNVEIWIGKRDREDHADDRDRFAESAGYDEAGLNVLYILIGDGLFVSTASHEELDRKI